MKIVVACGGTGGHAFPGLAVAQVLKERGHDVVIWASGRDVESGVLRSWDGPVFSTGARQFSLRNAFSIIRSVVRCRREMKHFAPDALLAMGSFASLSPVTAANKSRIAVPTNGGNTRR